MWIARTNNPWACSCKLFALDIWRKQDIHQLALKSLARGLPKCLLKSFLTLHTYRVSLLCTRVEFPYSAYVQSFLCRVSLVCIHANFSYSANTRSFFTLHTCRVSLLYIHRFKVLASSCCQIKGILRWIWSPWRADSTRWQPSECVCVFCW